MAQLEAEGEARQQGRGAATAQGIIDTDVHVYPHSGDEVRAYMKPPWRDRYAVKGTYQQRTLYAQPNGGARADSYPPGGGPPGSDPEFLREQLIRPYNVARAVLLPRTQCTTQPDPDFAAAIAAAFNDWLAETWLDRYNADGVFKGSINVATQDPPQAVAEIERWAGHPHFVQVAVDSGARAPYGQRCYWPIWEACERAGLPLAIHVGTDGLGINDFPTPGHPTHYIEWITEHALTYQAHLISLLTEGVFERFPGFRVALVEGGVSWLAPILWRLDNNWRSLRVEVPWMTRRPQEYVRDHVRVTSQPLERPDDSAHLLQMLEMMDAEHVLMLATDYPHWDFDSPEEAFPRRMPERLRRRIFFENAKEFYRL